MSTAADIWYHGTFRLNASFAQYDLRRKNYFYFLGYLRDRMNLRSMRSFVFRPLHILVLICKIMVGQLEYSVLLYNSFFERLHLKQYVLIWYDFMPSYLQMATNRRG